MIIEKLYPEKNTNMILISHRGNINGKNEIRENTPNYITEAIASGYDVEIDVWYKDRKWWLGHDNPETEIEYDWFLDRKTKLWIHCKNIEAIENLYQSSTELNYFWHQRDKLTITSKGFLWAYPGNQPIFRSIAVLPEIYNDDVKYSIGICSDIIEKYK